MAGATIPSRLSHASMTAPHTASLLSTPTYPSGVTSFGFLYAIKIPLASARRLPGTGKVFWPAISLATLHDKKVFLRTHRIYRDALGFPKSSMVTRSNCGFLPSLFFCFLGQWQWCDVKSESKAKNGRSHIMSRGRSVSSDWPWMGHDASGSGGGGGAGFVPGTASMYVHT